jgi:hypothetical protein
LRSWEAGKPRRLEGFEFGRWEKKEGEKLRR